MLSTIQQNDFLTFLGYCLSPDSQALPECAARICWTDLLQFAKKQSVVSIHWHGVRRMGSLEMNRPSEDDVMDWMVEVSKIAKRNRKVNAMAYHHPVISTPVGGIPEILKDEYNGRMVQPGNTECIAKAIYGYIDDKDAIKSQGENSYKVVQPFLPESVFASLKVVYQDLLS